MNNTKKINKPLILSGLVVGFILVYFVLIHDGTNPLLPNAEAKPANIISKLPNFSKIAEVKEKKETFFTTLYPIIQEENQHVLKLRNTLIRLQSTPFEKLNEEELVWLSDIATYYRLDGEVATANTINLLLERVDYIPPSLALTQAAIESGWGSSRFSKQGNNIFGQWCFSKGCGMVPSSRDSGKDHEVAKFSSVNEAVRAYIKNLNTNQSYAALREKRANLRKRGEPITGIALAQTLSKYSEEGSHYIVKVTKFINQNKLQRFTAEFEQSLLVVGN